MTVLKRSPKYDTFFLMLGLGVVGFIMVMTFLPYGHLRLTYDSYDIIGASESLNMYLNGKTKDGHSYLVRAPLHPFLLSFFQNKLLAMWWINLLSLIGSLVLILRICRLSDFSVNASISVAIIVGMFVPWLINFQFLWTEPVFIFLTLFLCYGLMSSWSLLPVIAICFVLFLTRKSGLFFFTAVAVFWIIDRKKLQAGVIFISGVAVFILWEWIEFAYGSTGFFPVSTKARELFQDFLSGSFHIVVFAIENSSCLSVSSCRTDFNSGILFF